MATRFAGRFQVGVVDVSFCRLESYSGVQSMDALLHLVGRLYYPCIDDVQGKQKASWLPSFEYAKGFTEFIFQRKKGWYMPMAKSSMQNTAWWMGQTQLPLYKGATPAKAEAKFPVLMLSHGIGGTRTSSSIICGTLASQGIAVFAIEHADGSASTAALAGGHGFLYYTGWGDSQERDRQVLYRMTELKTAMRVVRALSTGEPMQGLSLSDGADARATFRCLDAECVGLSGHSYGALTVGALAAQDPDFACAISIDPWWYVAQLHGMGQGAATSMQPSAEQGVAYRLPLLILGSQAWNTPNEKGQMTCDADNQRLVMHASAHRDGREAGTGPGSALVVIAGSTHDTAVDAKALYSRKYGWLLKWVIPHKKGTEGLRLDPVLGIELTAQCMLHFLKRHLPLLPAQLTMIEDAVSCGVLTDQEGAQVRAKQNAASTAGGGEGGGQRLPPVAMGAADQEDFERITHGHLFKLELGALT